MTLEKLYLELTRRALEYPDTCEESPWGERVWKVSNKIFLFSSLREGLLYVTVRLPQSGFAALTAPFAEPAGYGLARSGWVSMKIGQAKDVTLAQLFDWLDESYRTVAPKKLVKELPPHGPPPPSTTAPAPLPPITSHIALAGEDELRAERAVLGFRQVGVQVTVLGAPSPATMDVVFKAKPSRLVVDLSRQHQAGIELAKACQEMLPKLNISFAGVRDAPMQRKVAAALPDAHTSKLPPGDPKFIASLQALIGPAKSKR